MFRIDPKICKISPMMTKVMDNQLVNTIEDLEPYNISSTAQETNEESTSELGVCIVLGVFRCMVYGMYDVNKSKNIILNHNYYHLNEVRKSCLKTSQDLVKNHNHVKISMVIKYLKTFSIIRS